MEKREGMRRIKGEKESAGGVKFDSATFAVSLSLFQREGGGRSDTYDYRVSRRRLKFSLSFKE